MFASICVHSRSMSFLAKLLSQSRHIKMSEKPLVLRHGAGAVVSLGLRVRTRSRRARSSVVWLLVILDRFTAVTRNTQGSTSMYMYSCTAVASDCYGSLQTLH